MNNYNYSTLTSYSDVFKKRTEHTLKQNELFLEQNKNRVQQLSEEIDKSIRSLPTQFVEKNSDNVTIGITDYKDCKILSILSNKFNKLLEKTDVKIDFKEDCDYGFRNCMLDIRYGRRQLQCPPEGYIS